jgi:hypothetical protein
MKRGIVKRSKSTASVRLVGWLLAVIGTPITFLVLAGYGVALSVESVFGMPRAQVFSSPRDLIELSSVFIGQSIISLGEGLANFSYLKRLFDVYTPQVLAMLGAVVMCVLIWKLAPRLRQLAVFSRLTRGLSPVLKNKNVQGGFAFGIVILGAMVLLPFVWLLLIVLTTGILSAIAFVPIWALQVGTTFLDRYVVTPPSCLSQVKAPSLTGVDKKAHGALCVRVTTSHGSYSGRVVASTSDSIILWDGRFGVRKVSTTGHLVEVVSEEDCDCAKSASKPDQAGEYDKKP